METDDDDVVMLSNDEQNLVDSFNPTADTYVYHLKTTFESQFFAVRRLFLSKSARKMPKSVAITMQKFVWDASNGYIYCEGDSHLVFGVKEIESKVVEVTLKRRNPDDIFQRWTILPVDEEEHNEFNPDLTKPL